MRLADFIMLSIFGAVMIIGTSVVLTDLNNNYGTTMAIDEIDGAMNVSKISNASINFQTDIRSAQNSSNFVSTILNGIGAASSLIGLTMTAVDQLFGLAGVVLSFFAPPSMTGLITGAIVTIICLLIISIPFRWELSR